MKRIIIDVNGSDAGAATVVEGAVEALSLSESFGLVLVGDSAQITKNLSANERIEIVDAPVTLSNLDLPTAVIKEKSDSSMAVALKLLSDSDAIGMLSCGSTGGLLIGSIFILGLIGKLKIPALASLLPTVGGKYVCLADCGANVDSRAGDIAEYALMGSAYVKSMRSIKDPKVGLLSVGRESTKGSKLSKEAFSALSALPISFVGNVEPDSFTLGEVDVIVSDGFSGNVLLKALEAAGKSAISLLDSAIANETESCIVAALQQTRNRLYYVYDYNSQGGATFLGVKKIVVKGHGGANKDTVCSCIEQILKLHSGGFIPSLTDALT